METIIAIYEDGVFRPLSPVTLPEHTQVELQMVQTEGVQSEHNYSFIGIFNSGKPDLAERVEEILGQTAHDAQEGWSLSQ